MITDIPNSVRSIRKKRRTRYAPKGSILSSAPRAIEFGARRGWLGKSPWFRAARAHAGKTISIDGTVATAQRAGVRRRLGKSADASF
jgi:hypothetical protein